MVDLAKQMAETARLDNAIRANLDVLGFPLTSQSVISSQEDAE